MRGRKPKPKNLKLVQGNAGRRPLPEDEPEPVAGLPPAPDHLNDEAKAEWARVGEDLAALGLVTAIDRAVLAAYCVAWARWVDAEEKLLEFGPVVKATNGSVSPSPYLSISNKAQEQMLKTAVEFGMTPSSRTRVHAVLPLAEDEFEKFLRGEEGDHEP